MKVIAIKGGTYYFRRKYFKYGKLVGFISLSATAPVLIQP